MLVDPKKNPVRNQLYEAQIVYHNLSCKKRQLQRKLIEHANGGRRYKMAFVKKKVSDKNRQERERYGWDHEHDTIESYYSSRKAPSFCTTSTAQQKKNNLPNDTNASESLEKH